MPERELNLVRITDEMRNEDWYQQLLWLDNTKLVAMNTCPTYASITYGHNKRITQVGRQMALEAGSLCHDVFALVRIYDLLLHGAKFYKERRPDFFYDESYVQLRAEKLFGERWADLYKILKQEDDPITNLSNAAIVLINTSNYYDNPDDTKRTITNLEDACLAYIQKYPLNTYIPFVHNDFVGVEQSYELLVTDENDEPVAIFVGKLDGLCWDKTGTRIELHENKTGSRIDEVWSASHDMSHQQTGYMLAASTVLSDYLPARTLIDHGLVFGLAIPQPRRASTTFGFMRHPIDRSPTMFSALADWFYYTLKQWQMYGQDPIDAPKFTHSCNRYFTACSLIPFCRSDIEDKQALLDSMFTHVWDPRDE